MAELQLSIKDQAKIWISNGLSDKEIKSKLVEVGVEERNIPELYKEVIKMKRARNMTHGLGFILLGALLCLVSCVYTLLSSGGSNDLMLYGLTSLGIIVVFIGLMKIFG